MRLSGLALAAALALAATAAAQQAPPRLPATATPPAAPAPSAAPAPDPALDGHLRRWEQEMQRFQTLYLKLQRVDHDRTLNTTTKYSGAAYFMKAGSGPSARNLILLQTFLEGTKNPNDFAEKFVCTGTYFYQFSREMKEVRAYELPRNAKGAMPDDNFLGMFGLRSDEARRRYDLKLSREDANFIYIDIKPRLPRDLEEFTQAQIVLSKSNFIPRRVWYKQPNSTEVLWDIQGAEVNKKMDQRWFDKPETPAGWKLINNPLNSDNPRPTVIRNSGTP
jgi:TIGR03009 family protein